MALSRSLMPSVMADNGDAAGRIIFGLNCVVGLDTNRDFIEIRLLKKFGTSNAEWCIENTLNNSLKLSVIDNKSLASRKVSFHASGEHTWLIFGRSRVFNDYFLIQITKCRSKCVRTTIGLENSYKDHLFSC